jgi:hypothetical protein
VGFILGGLACFAIAQHVSNRRVKIGIQTLGFAAGPIFFIVVVIFSRQERQKTYEMEWLTGASAAAYYVQVYKQEHPPDPGTVVVLKRNIDRNRLCFSDLSSKELTKYLENLPTHTVKVKYVVTYDFYRLRGYYAEGIGEFPGITSSVIETASQNSEPCFPY